MADPTIAARVTAELAAADAKIASHGEELRATWTAELCQLRDSCSPSDLTEHAEHFLARMVPSPDRNTWWWRPFAVTAETPDAVIALVVDGAVRRYVADAESDVRHELAAGINARERRRQGAEADAARQPTPQQQP